MLQGREGEAGNQSGSRVITKAENTGSRPSKMPKMVYGTRDSSFASAFLTAVVISLLSPIWAG